MLSALNMVIRLPICDTFNKFYRKILYNFYKLLFFKNFCISNWSGSHGMCSAKPFQKSNKKPSDDLKFLLNIGDLILHIKVRNAQAKSRFFFFYSFLLSPHSPCLFCFFCCVQSRKRVNLHGRTRIHLTEKIIPQENFFRGV